ncbi:MAG TPA: TonB-dependent receptor, partial [Chitinophagaceae bacterium]|nr:TonB-dependent receptor [Chitinophagaceae bacterium]
MLLLFSCSLQAQYAIRGAVKDRNGAGLEATVRLGDSSYAAGRDGAFIIRSLAPGRYTLVVRHPEYTEQETAVQLTDRDVEVTILLEQKIKSLQDVTVRDLRTGFGFTRLRNVDGFSIFAGKKSEVILTEKLTANLSTNNARQVYSKVAGLNIYENDGAGLQLSIGGRGLDPNRTANFNVRQNGYDIAADALGYPESYYTPPVEALRRIQIVRGAASLQYGTQFGGLLNFQMKQPRTTDGVEVVSRNTAGSYGYLATFNSVDFRAGKWNSYSFFQYKRGDGFRPNSKFDAKTAYFDLHYDYKENSHVGIEVTHMDYLAQQPGGLTDAMFRENPRQSNRSRNWFSVNWNLLDLEWEHEFSKATRLNLRSFALLANRQSLGFRPARPASVDNGTEREMIRGDFQNVGAEARFVHHYSWLKKDNVLLLGGRLYRGYNHSRQGFGNAKGRGAEFGFPVDSLVLSDYRFPNHNASLFAEQIFYLNSRWSVTPGIRYEYIRTLAKGFYRSPERDLAGNIINNKATEEQRVNPRSFVLLGVGVSYKPKDYLEVYGNISQNYRSVTFNDIRITNPTLQVDPQIADEKGFSGDLGLRGNLRDVFNYDISLFSMLYGKRIGEVWRENTLIKLRTNVGKAWIAGVESYLELNIPKALKRAREDRDWSLFANTAVIHSRYIESPYSNVKGKEVEFIPTLNLKLGSQWRYKAFKSSLQYSYL